MGNLQKAERVWPISVLEAAENRKSPKTCGNRKINGNVAENWKRQFFSGESRKRTPYTIYIASFGSSDHVKDRNGTY